MKYYSDEFLQKLNKARLRSHYVKIILLSFKEETPIKEIQGEIISGSISVNSSSAIRRTVSLSMAVNEESAKIENIDNEISINKKIKLEIGLKNPFPQYIDQYGEIIWFPQGVFVLSSVNSSHNTNSWNLSITAKDKMCLLDGSAGGTFPAATVVSDKYIYLKDGSVQIEYPVLRQIIYEAVNHYGGEDPSNIFINDLEDQIKMLVKYDGFKPIWWVKKAGRNGIYTFIEPSDEEKSSSEVRQVNSGEDAGYRLTDFTYPGELVLNPGETVATLLDKITKVLGNYEYFYDIEGHFIFQEIKNYVNKQSPLDELTSENKDNENYLPNLPARDYIRIYNTSKSVLQITDLETTTAITHTPKYDNVKNDFYVWGQKSENHPIHYHLAIDIKPLPDFSTKWMIPVYDEDEVLIDYDFKDSGSASKYLALNKGDTYYIGDATSKTIQKTALYYVTNESEAYYHIRISSEGKNVTPRVKKSDHPVVKEFPVDLSLQPATPYEWREELYRQALYAQTKAGFGYDNNIYYEELIAFWRDQYDPSKWSEWGHWNPDVFENPDKLEFWLDIIDTGTDLGRYSISQIGRRSKAVNKTEIKTIYNKEVPDLLFVPSDESKITPAEQEIIDLRSQDICYLPESKEDLFSISTTGASCFDEIRDLLYQHLNYHTTVSITCLPVYYLEPNNIIRIEDAKSGIIGNYQITQFTLPLAYNGTMSIAATEVFQRI